VWRGCDPPTAEHPTESATVLELGRLRIEARLHTQGRLLHPEERTLAPAMGEPLRFRNLSAARDAYSCADETLKRTLSREAHGLLAPKGDSSLQAKVTSTWSPWASNSEAGHNEVAAHSGSTIMLRAAVDGVVASLFTFSLGDAAGWPTGLTLILNGATLICWALYTAGREALEIKTYEAYHLRERQREAWELDNFPEGEVEEMVQLYCKRGLPEQTARMVISGMATVPEFFVDVMMLVRGFLGLPTIAQPARTCTSPLSPSLALLLALIPTP
jgi:hypothetical protein